MTTISPTIDIGTNQARRVALLNGPDRWWGPACVETISTPSRFDVPTLRQALRCVLRRHTGLRTFFAPGDGPALARCLDPVDADWPVELVTQGPPGDASSAAETEAVKRLIEGFDPASPPLVRALLIRRRTEDWLGIAIDHAIFDGASLAPFMQDLADVYTHLADGVPPSALEQRQTDAGRFAQWESAWLRGPEGERCRRYWAAQWRGFESAPRLTLPFAAPTGAVAGVEGAGGGRIVALSGRDMENMRERARRLRLTPFMLMATVTMLTLRQFGTSDRIGMLLPFARRGAGWTERIIGYLSSPILFSADVPAGATAESLAPRIRAATAGSVQHGMFSYDQILREFYESDYASRPRVPHATLNVVQRAPYPTVGGLPVEAADLPVPQSFDFGPGLHLTLIITAEGGAELLCTYRREMCAEELVQRILTQIVQSSTSPD